MSFFRVSSRRHWWVIGAYLLVVLLTAVIAVAGGQVLNAVRAYSAGESLWAKAQQAAVRHLQAYAVHHDPLDHELFLQALRTNHGDRRARLELGRADPNLDIARAGLIEGGNDPADVDAMIWLYRSFKSHRDMAEAFAIWEQADQAIDELQQVGRRMRDLIEAGATDSTNLRQLQQDLPGHAARLNGLGGRFAAKLGDASRAAHEVVRGTTLLLSALLAAGGLWLIGSMLRKIGLVERALREGNERWALAADAAGIGVFDWNVASQRVDVDTRAALLVGLPPVAGRVTFEQFAARARVNGGLDGVRPVLDAAIHHGDPVLQRYHVNSAVDGLSRHVELSARVRTHGRAPRMIGIVRDVSEEFRTEQLRLEKEAAERANRVKGEFLSRASHELRTPLNAVLGFAQLMELDANDPLTAQQQERLRHVIDSGRHLLELINDMLDVSTIDNGAVVLRPADVPVAPLMTQCSSRYAELGEAHAVKLRVDEPLPALSVRADPQRIEQVLGQLITNGIKYNRPDGEVRLSVSQQGEHALIAVEDTGPGMTREQVGQLFQPFNRLGAEFSGEPGSGLGLVVAQQLVRLMGGSIEVHSEAGKGSSFVVQLPLAEPSGAQMPLGHRLEQPSGVLLYR